MVNGWEHLDSRNRYLVAQSTSELVDEWTHDAIRNLAQEGGGVIGLDDANQLLIHETTDETTSSQPRRDSRNERKDPPAL